jgi:lipopolysaccharide export system protein LptA
MPLGAMPQQRPLDEKKPVKISSKRLRYHERMRETEFIGDVVAVHDTTTFMSDRLFSSAEGESATAQGHLHLSDPLRKVEIWAEEGSYAQSMEEASLNGNVILRSVDPYAVAVTISGQSGWYQRLSRRARVTGGVEVFRGHLTASAQTASLEGGKNEITLEGRVLAHMLSSTVKAERAVIDGMEKSARFEGGVEANMIPAQLRASAAHPEQP